MLGRKGKSIFAQQQQQMPAGGVDYAAMQPGLGQQQPQGVDWKNLAGQFVGNLSDSIATSSGGAPVFRQMMAQRAQAEQQAQQMRAQADAKAQERSYGREDWLFKQKYQAENPTPGKPHYWETNNGSLARVGPDGQPEVVYEDPTPKINWIRADNGDGTQSLIPVGPQGPIGPQGGGGNILPSFTDDDWNKGQPMGGAGSNASGGFRR